MNELDALVAQATAEFQQAATPADLENAKARYLGKGVLRAVENLNTEVSEALMGLDAQEQTFLDRTLIELDGTEGK